jgi:hypothetical protein
MKMHMKRTTAFLIIFQFLLVTLSTHLHSASATHDAHDMAHVHFEHSHDHHEDVNDNDQEHDNTAHSHFVSEVLCDSEVQLPQQTQDHWELEFYRSPLTLLIRPPVPPPDVV